MTLLVQPTLKAGSTARQPSAFWPQSEVLSVLAGDQDGIYLFEDFECVDTTVATNVGKLIMRSGGWRSREDTSCSILQLATETGGVLRLLTDTTDNNEVYMQAGGGAGRRSSSTRRCTSAGCSSSAASASTRSFPGTS
jgi:hypothetical protein